MARLQPASAFSRCATPDQVTRGGGVVSAAPRSVPRCVNCRNIVAQPASLVRLPPTFANGTEKNAGIVAAAVE